MGCGTGFLTEIFLQNGNKVIGIEPNEEMRKASVIYLDRYIPQFFSCIFGKAESCSLPDHSVNHIVCGESFHWFNVERALKEFNRILDLDGKLFIFSNWEYKHNKFTVEYSDFIRKYQSKSDNNPPPNIEWNRIFSNKTYKIKRMWLRKSMNFEEILGYTMSLSRIPLPYESNWGEMKNILMNIFNRYKLHEKIEFQFKIEMKYGKISSIF